MTTAFPLPFREFAGSLSDFPFKFLQHQRRMNGSLSGHPGKVPAAYHQRSVSLKSQFGDLPGGPVAKSSHSQCLGSIPGQGTRSHKLQLKPGTAQ